MYWPFWVSVTVLDLNQNKGLGPTQIKVEEQLKSYCPNIYTRCLIVSTDQADPSCFYFRILMEQH
jgi:hypothetical protein